MGVLDAPMAKVAQSLVKTFGRPATLRAYGAPFYDTPTGSVSHAGGYADVACHVAISEYAERQIDGTAIRRGDRRAIVSRLAIGGEPVADRDKIIEGGRTWRIVAVRGFSSGEQEAAYECQLRV